MLTATACASLPAATQVPANTSDPLASELAAYMEQQEANLSFTGAALVARGGRVLLQRGYGAADRQSKRPNTEHTRLRIASISKQFTAVAILLLQERGELDVQDAVCLYLSDCPETWKAITLHQLLTHTSGIPSHLDLPDYPAIRATPAAPADLMERFQDLPLEFPPGESWSYTDSGYDLLGLVIERASGLAYGEFLQENIFAPLGMKHTGYLDATGEALGYENSSALAQAAHGDPTFEFAAGGLYSTVGDLYLWDRALFDDRFLPSDLRQMAFTAFEPMPESFWPMRESAGPSYGYGFMIGDMYGHRFVGHTGRLEGFVGGNFYFPDEGAAVILLGNQRDLPLGSLVKQLVSMVFEGAY